MRSRWISPIAVALLLLVGLMLMRPIRIQSSSNSNPVNSYSAAVKRIELLKAQDTQDVNPVCHTQFMSHDKRVERTIVFSHGFTNCPQQFREIGMIFYNLGYNVLIPRMPHHGLTDRMTQDQAQLTAEDLIVFADEMINIAQGLGDHVTIVGFSAGGSLTGWLAQNRGDTDRVVLISPVFGLNAVPTALTKPATNLVLILPNFFLWWDSELKTDLPGPEHAYPRFSSHALGEILRLGLAIQADTRQSKPASQSILVVINANDTSVNNKVTAEVVQNWRKNGVKNLQTYEFEADLQLNHDLIDPKQVDQRINIVYPVLVDLITK